MAASETNLEFRQPRRIAGVEMTHGGRSCIICILALSLVLVVIALIAVSALHTHTVAVVEVERRTARQVCRTEDCYQLGALILNNANFSADPCTNFFEYACGSYSARARHGRWEWFTKTTRQDMLASMYAGVNQVLLYPELRNKPLPNDAKDWLPPLSVFYHSCLAHQATAEAPFRLPFHNSRAGRWLDLGYIFTGSPSSQIPGVEEILARLMLYQAPFLLEFQSFDNVLDERGIVPFKLRLNLNPALCSPTVRLLVREVVKLSVEPMPASDETFLQSVAERVCSQLQDAHIERNRRTNGTNSTEPVMTPAQMIESQPENSTFRFKTFFEVYRKEANLPRPLADRALRRLRLQLASSDISEVLNSLLTKISAVDFNNLAVLHFLVHRVKYMGGRLRAAVQRYIPDKARALLDISEIKVESNIEHYENWHRCILMLSYIMPPLMTRAFVDEYLSPEQIKKVDDVIKSVKSSFIDNLRMTDWIDPADKEMSIAKVNAIKLHVGYPEIYRDARLIEKVYSDLNVTVRNFNWNYIRHSHYAGKWLIWELAEGRAELWSLIAIQPLAVQAYYVPEYNQIFLATGILQPPILYADMDDQFLLGGIGFVIGHEIGHAFDPYGHKTPFANTTFAWNISSTTEQRYHDRLPCISKGYENIEDRLFNSSQRSNSSIGNDLADLVGLRATVKAFTSLGKNNLKRLPGIKNLTPEKTFLLHSVQIFCSAPTKRYYEKIYYPSHSPDFVRVIGAWRNTAYFSEAFECKDDAFMNPDNKCRIF